VRRLAATVALLLALAGCGAEPPTPPPPAYNGTDVMFLQMMVPHHRQGLTIAGLARDRADSVAVRTLATAIEATQTDEVRIMSGWLRDWRQPPEAGSGAHAEHGGMPDTTEWEIATLRRTYGPEFDRRFLNVLIAHQDDAIQLAAMETATGVNADATALARRITESRSAQIDQMLRLLGQG